ncbi:MAG: hypothetical protein M1482_15090 [Chloroflexi bacterium]|nr:hypothetical protein [Chloroflexota bacterium]
MKIFAIISEYGDCRELCFEVVAKQIPTTRVTTLFAAIIGKDAFAPLQSEAYLFEGDLKFTTELADEGVELRVLPPVPGVKDQTDLYEAVTPVPFARLRAILRRYSKPIGFFTNQRQPPRFNADSP